MEWQKLYSQKRTGVEEDTHGPRTEFQRDFDRIVFSSPFRRLQNKTQVFPLPGSVFVHNRLTHSLEVASVGRSLGKICGERLALLHPEWSDDAKDFYKYNLSEVVAAACLAHDIGNPAFGHSGEDAIANYFKENSTLKTEFNISKEIWTDFTAFEGNANALRVLTRGFPGKQAGGFRLTYTTLAAILKYPCESIAKNKKFKHRKKYGCFQSEKELLKDIFQTFGIIPESKDPLIYPRHPFVYLVEVADDICYQIIDLEDACRLKILPFNQVSSLLLGVIETLTHTELDKIKKTLDSIGDENEKIAFLRAKVINSMILKSADVFMEAEEEIIQGNWNHTLTEVLKKQSTAIKEIEDISIGKIYNHPSVLEIEIAGFEVMSKLLDLWIQAAKREEKTPKDKIVLQLIPAQFGNFDLKQTPLIEQLYQILDYVSGMTDLYAMELFQKVQGIQLSKYR